jgi:uncharacterized protein
VTAATAHVVDACCHPIPAQAADLNARLPRHYRDQRLPPPLGGVWANPVDDYLPEAGPAGGGLPGSDPANMHAQVLVRQEADFAVLVPLTRGLLADPQVGVALDRATNEWLAETWLGEYNAHDRYRGSIRVSPRSPIDAVAEIARWADHPGFVQVAVPLESNVTYGDPMLLPVWEAAADRGLPVVVHSDHAGGVHGAPTPLGYPLTYLEAYTQSAFAALAHLASLIAHGTFERLPRLMFVFADGGFDYLQTLLWRVDKDWRSGRAEVPWVDRTPSGYLADHVRFVIHAGDGEDDPEAYAEFIELNRLEPCLLYGSNYPHWDHLDAAQLSPMLGPAQQMSILGDNARALYGLPVMQRGAV